MSDYTVSRISPTDKRAVRQMDALLEKEGIERDKNLDYSIGLFDDDYNLVATVPALPTHCAAWLYPRSIRAKV